MSKLKCPKCRSEYLGVRADNYCLSCGWNNYTVFHEITASPEVLAPKFVYNRFYMEHQGDLSYWVSSYFSTIIPGKSWEYEAEAIAATVAKLMEVCDATD